MLFQFFDLKRCGKYFKNSYCRCQRNKNDFTCSLSSTEYFFVYDSSSKYIFNIQRTINVLKHFLRLYANWSLPTLSALPSIQSLLSLTIVF